MGCNREGYSLEETQSLCYCIARLNFAGAQLRYQDHSSILPNHLAVEFVMFSYIAMRRC